MLYPKNHGMPLGERAYQEGLKNLNHSTTNGAQEYQTSSVVGVIYIGLLYWISVGNWTS
jgi:hypothetical protein